MTFTVLFVCTGNICRSPFAARLLLSRVAADAPIEAGSAGIRPVLGHGIDKPMAAALRELGGTADGHVARPLVPEVVGASDLVLGATGEHRSRVLETVPQALRRTFTMREFVRLGTALPAMTGPPTVDQLRARVAEVAAMRGQLPAQRPGADDIPDPFGAAPELVQACVIELVAVVDATLRILGLRE